MNQKLIDKGQFWEEGIQLIDGCTPCSPGCDHCWSAALAYRFNIKGDCMTYRHADGRIDFCGCIYLHPDRLARFNTRKPKVFAVWNDLFYEKVPLEFQDYVYREMARQYQNQYIILTKRAENMQRILKLNTVRKDKGNIWNGLTICTQPEADEKKVFLDVPGNKFLCLEPLLEQLNIKDYVYDYPWHICNAVRPVGNPKEVDAVIVGPETGPGRRPCKLEWVESIIDQCDAAGVMVFVKALDLNGRVSKNMADWPEKFRRRELPWM